MRTCGHAARGSYGSIRYHSSDQSVGVARLRKVRYLGTNVDSVSPLRAYIQTTDELTCALTAFESVNCHDRLRLPRSGEKKD